MPEQSKPQSVKRPSKQGGTFEYEIPQINNDSGLIEWREEDRPKLITPIRKAANWYQDTNGNWFQHYIGGSEPLNQSPIPGSNERPQLFKKSLDIDIAKESKDHQ